MAPEVTPLITGAVVGFLGLLLWAARRGQPQADPETGTLVFRHSILFRGFALFAGFGVPLAITLLVILYPPKDRGDFLAVLGLYGLFFGLSAPLLWEGMRYALTVSPQGLDCRSPWRGGRFLTWDEVQDISYSTLSSWFIIRARDGWKFRAPILVPGLARFLEQCERYLPPAALRKAEAGYSMVGRPFPGAK
jgi:hypothetical protein